MNERFVFFKTIGTIFFILFGLLFLLGVYLSHKVAGPLYAFQREMRVLISGRGRAFLRFRFFDELKFLEKPFNNLTEYYYDREEKRYENNENIKKKLSEAQSIITDSNEVMELESLIKELE